METIDVSIIIVSYNTKDLLYSCLNSIKKNTKNINYEIIIFDNNSSDGTIKMLYNKFPDIKLIKNSSNVGFAQGCNRSVEISKGQYLFFLNSDAEIKNNAIKELHKFIKEKKDAKIVGGRIVDNNYNDIHSYGNIPSFYEFIITLLPNVSINKGEKIKSVPFDVPRITGADLFILRKDFMKYDGFDERFFMYFEETDFQKRFLNDKDRKAYIVPSAIIKHKNGGSFEKESYIKLIIKFTSRLQYINKNFGNAHMSIYFLIVILISIPKILINKKPYKLKFLWDLILNFIKIIRNSEIKIKNRN